MGVKDPGGERQRVRVNDLTRYWVDNPGGRLKTPSQSSKGLSNSERRFG